jgi:hypothetical protein
MKIYLFNRETGSYLGENIAGEAPMKKGTFVIPSGATTIVPPQVSADKELIFNMDKKRWETHYCPNLASDNALTTHLKEKMK